MLLSSETFLTSAEKCFCFSEFTSIEASFVPNTYPLPPPPPHTKKILNQARTDWIRKPARNTPVYAPRRSGSPLRRPRPSRRPGPCGGARGIRRRCGGCCGLRRSGGEGEGEAAATPQRLGRSAVARMGAAPDGREGSTRINGRQRPPLVTRVLSGEARLSVARFEIMVPEWLGTAW
jgi:hypothetical protein